MNICTYAFDEKKSAQTVVTRAILKSEKQGFIVDSDEFII